MMQQLVGRDLSSGMKEEVTVFADTSMHSYNKISDTHYLTHITLISNHTRSISAIHSTLARFLIHIYSISSPFLLNIHRGLFTYKIIIKSAAYIARVGSPINQNML